MASVNIFFRINQKQSPAIIKTQLIISMLKITESRASHSTYVASAARKTKAMQKKKEAIMAEIASEQITDSPSTMASLVREKSSSI